MFMRGNGQEAIKVATEKCRGGSLASIMREVGPMITLTGTGSMFGWNQGQIAARILKYTGAIVFAASGKPGCGMARGLSIMLVVHGTAASGSAGSNRGVGHLSKKMANYSWVIF